MLLLTLLEETLVIGDTIFTVDKTGQRSQISIRLFTSIGKEPAIETSNSSSSLIFMKTVRTLALRAGVCVWRTLKIVAGLVEFAVR